MKKMNTGAKKTLFYTTLISPVGPIYIAFTKKGASRIVLGIDSEKDFIKYIEMYYNMLVKKGGGAIVNLKREFHDYFALSAKIGSNVCSVKTARQKGKSFSFGFPIDLLDGTSFEKKAWLKIRKIPYGKVISYKDLAGRIGRPEAARAVGMACKKNPLPILIPCHRIVGKDRSLTGYSSGINIKKRLLELEGVQNIKQ